MSVPKIIHQMWLDKFGKDVSTPPKKNYIQNIEDVQNLNEDYEYFWWNNSAVLKVFEHPDLQRFKQFYLDLTPHICRCDFARYAIMYRYGGIYFDLDFKFMNPIPEEMLNHRIIFTHEPDFQGNFYKDNIYKITSKKTNLANNILLSEPENNFWLELMDEIVRFYEQHGMPKTVVAVVKTTGPRMISNFVDDVLSMGNNYGVHLISDSSLFFGYPNLDSAISYNDWNDGTGWGLSHLTEFQTGQVILTYLIFVIVLLIILSLVLIGLCAYRGNSKYDRTLSQDFMAMKRSNVRKI